jgi:predicted metalloprotease
MGEQSIDAFLTSVLEDIDAYWTTTLRASDLPEPRVSYVWIPPGRVADSACGEAGEDAAFYCPGDDTIYVSQRFAADLYRGVVRGLPGQSAGFGRAAGDFGVAYVLAHEYAHNLQQEFGVFSRPSAAAEPFELQADCLAGAWGNSVYREGHLAPGDVEEAINTALAVGDFDVGNAQHHGTPEQRREAWLLGFESGDPSSCDRYVPA